MRTILRVLLLCVVATTGQLHAQRCGYDYLQAFVIKAALDDDTQQVEKLTLTLIGGGGQPISYSQEWANEVGRVTGKKEVDRYFSPKLKKKYYVLFFDSRSYDPRKPPVWYVKVELTGNNSRLHKNFSKLFKVSPSEGNYLCGHTGPYKIRTLNLSDTVEVRIPPSVSEKPTPVNVDARKKGKEDIPQKKEVELPKRPKYPSVFIKQKQVQWIEMKGKDYLFKDSLRIYNRGAEAAKLPKLEWTMPQYEELLEFRRVNAPEELKAGDSGWIVVELGVSKVYTGNVYRLPFEEKRIPLKFQFDASFIITAEVRYWVVDGNLLDESEGDYVFKPTPQKWFWVVEKTPNYGKCMRVADTLMKIGNWHMGLDHRDITYSRNFQFQVLRDRAVVKNATIWSVKNGEKRKIDYVESGDFQLVWLPSGIDTVFFEKDESVNFLMGFNKEFSNSMYMVELFDWTRSDYFLRQYPEFRTYQGYRFVDTVFLVKIPNTNPELFNKRLQTMQQELQVTQEARYDAGYYNVSFNLREVVRAKKIMRGWLGKGWIESAHQGLVLASGSGGGMTYLSGEITLKPITHQWIPEYQKMADTTGFKLFHSFGDGTVMLGYQERFIDAEVFYKQLKFSEDKRWKYSNPGFLNPIRIEPDDMRYYKD